MHHRAPLAEREACRLGEFEIDLATSRLSYRGQSIHLTKRTFDVLALLVRHAGHTVDKDQLIREVWGGVCVEENNLARHISVIRKIFHSFEPDREYVLTVPSRGYQFVIPQVEAEPPATPLPTASASRSWSRQVAQMTVLVALSILGGTLLVAPLLEKLHIRQPTVSGAPGVRSLRQVTSAGGLDDEPAWAPDGRTLAFASDRSGNLDIWIQRIGEATPVQLTTNSARDSQPAWSPDGRWLAFRSEREGGGIFIVPSTGGVEQRMTAFGHAPQWSPDGTRLLFTGETERSDAGVYVVPAIGGSPLNLASESLSGFRTVRATWHPDGRIAVLGRRAQEEWKLWTHSLTGGDWREVERARDVDARMRELGLLPSRLAWAPNGDRLYFIARSRAGDDIYRVGVDTHTLRWTIGPERLTTESGRYSGFAVSPDGHQIAVTRRLSETRIWSLPFDPVAGQVTSRGEPLTPFGSEASVVDMSPDGQQLAYRTVHGGREELWVHSVSTTSSRLAAIEERAQILQPRWSTDNRRLAYLRLTANAASESAVVLVDSRAAMTNQVLPQSRGTTQVYDWAPDQASLLVGCANGERLIALCTLPARADGAPTGAPRVIATDPGRSLFSARTSPNRRWITFLAIGPRTGNRTVYAMPASGGPWVSISEQPVVDKPRWSPDGLTVYYVALQGGSWNLWGRRFDALRGVPAERPFQVTRFDTPGFAIEVGPPTQLSITRNRLVVPVTESAGAVWILADIDR
jgi:Tol biopolymer transport system component/DNA-binding winged helix-turn-helix (wHTH) protein